MTPRHQGTPLLLAGRSQCAVYPLFSEDAAGFSAELDELIGDVARLARRAGQMMTDASTALWQPDLRLTESIISGDSEITTALCDDIGHRCVRLLHTRDYGAFCDTATWKAAVSEYY